MSLPSGSPWPQFLSALEGRGVSFSSIAYAADRTSVIHAAGFRDPLEVAVIETEWHLRVQNQSPMLLTGSESRSDGNSAARGTIGGAVRPRSGSGALVAPNAAAAVKSTVLDAYAPDQLATAPEEVQDSAIAVELLSAILGHGGSYFVSKHGTQFEASPFVPVALRVLVAPALHLANAYHSVVQAEGMEFGGRSLVTMALGEVISEVTANFAHNIATLEQHCRGRSMPLMMVIAETQRIGQHILRLQAMLPDLQADGMVGGRLLNFLHDLHTKLAGSKDDEQLLAVLLRRASKPYLNILRQWITEGVLRDPYQEFFVAEHHLGGPSSSSASTGSGADLSKRPALNMSVAAFRDLVSATASVGSSSAAAASSGGVEVPEVYNFDRRFSLDKTRIPSFLLTQGRAAKMVFYSGKYCCLLREFNGELPDFSALSTGDGPTADTAANSSSSSSLWQWTNADRLHRLVEDCYHRSSGAMLTLLRGPQMDLMGHLESLKTFFLQQRGDWLVDFLDHAEELLHKSPVQVKAQSIRVLLQSAIAKSCSADPYHTLIGCSFADTTFPQYIELSLRQTTQARGSGRLSTMHVETRRCIELLQLEVDLRWPLTLIVDPIAVKHMNNVFRLLLWIKVCERSVYRWWNKNIHSTRAHGIKQQMVQFLRQFQFYAAHFVIEPNWAKLVGRMNGAEDVLSLSHALQDFFEHLEHGLILSSLSRFRCLSKVLDLILRFGELGRVAPGRPASDPQLEETLKATHDSFLKLLSDLASPRGEDYPQLVPLLTWIDFSRYYDQRGVYRVQHGNLPAQPEVSALAAAKSAAAQQQRTRESVLHDGTR